jgi:hypothetical protein
MRMEWPIGRRIHLVNISAIPKHIRYALSLTVFALTVFALGVAPNSTRLEIAVQADESDESTETLLEGSPAYDKDSSEQDNYRQHAYSSCYLCPLIISGKPLPPNTSSS